MNHADAARSLRRPLSHVDYRAWGQYHPNGDMEQLLGNGDGESPIRLDVVNFHTEIELADPDFP